MIYYRRNVMGIFSMFYFIPYYSLLDISNFMYKSRNRNRNDVYPTNYCFLHFPLYSSQCIPVLLQNCRHRGKSFVFIFYISYIFDSASLVVLFLSPNMLLLSHTCPHSYICVIRYLCTGIGKVASKKAIKQFSRSTVHITVGET